MTEANKEQLEALLLSQVPQDGAPIGNKTLFENFQRAASQSGWTVDDSLFQDVREGMVTDGRLKKGKGRGGSVMLAEPVEGFDLQAEEPTEAPSRKTPQKPKGNAPRSKKGEAEIISYRHQDKRKNNPEVGMVKPENDPDDHKDSWCYDPHIDPALQFDFGRAQVEKLIDDALASGDTDTMREALEELKRYSAPYLNWTGKAERTTYDVDTVSLHVHERIDPASILAAVRKRLHEGKGKGAERAMQPDLFAAPFENMPLRDAIDFYKHERGWANRLIAGDSLLVMNSLLQKEGMAGQVQMIYIDPPYGIKYGSNFQPFTNKRDVKDRNDADLTQEPEMIKAFRDTWELGIHSYLTYLRDRLLLARELLAECGSVFVQISDENLHHVKELLDEVFGSENFLALINFVKTAGQSDNRLAGISDYLVWYAKDTNRLKYNQLYYVKALGGDGASGYNRIEETGGRRRSIKAKEDISELTGRVFTSQSMESQSPGTKYPVDFQGSVVQPSGYWKTQEASMPRLRASSRLMHSGRTLRYIRYFDDFPVYPVVNLWSDTGVAGFASDKKYVVETSAKVVERCMLMSSDPGDLVLDPTCGSGTSAFVAEKWGRRWITCDTSRVAVTLAKQRLMTASYDYYDLKYPHEGLKSGFIYKTVPHVTLKSIANNPEIDEIHARMHPVIVTALDALNAALKGQPITFKVTEGGRKGKKVEFSAADTKRVELSSGERAAVNALLEWEVPFDFPHDWPESARAPFDAVHAARQAMQQKMDASIAAHADQETLYDQPQVAKDKLRITGPFTVEAVPFPSVLSLNETEQPQEADVAVARSGESARQHSWRDELLKTGIRGKGGDVLRFAELETLPDSPHLHVTGHLDSGERVVVSFGPEHSALEQRQVALALNEAEKLRPAPKFIIFASFEFDPEAAKDIDETKWPGVTLLKAKMNADLLTDDLKKGRSSNQSFWLMGQPDVEVRQRKDGQYEVEVSGFDYFDTKSGELISGGKGKIAMWLLDTDYDERSLYPRQVFFPMAGKQDGWFKLKKNIRAELNEGLLDKFHGTVSLPFEAGEYKKVAVKIVDDRGIESLKIIGLD